MSTKSPTPLSLPEEQLAFAEMMLDLLWAVHCANHTYKPVPKRMDSNLSAVALAVLIGHARGRGMTLSQIAKRAHTPESTAKTRLAALIKLGTVCRIKNRYYLEGNIARDVPHRETFRLILTRGLETISPFISADSAE